MLRFHNVRQVLFFAIALGLVSLSARAQTPDTTSAWRYYPLEVGNTWEYESYIQVKDPNTTCTYEWELQGYITYVITGKMLIQSDEGPIEYFIRESTNYDLAHNAGESSEDFVRYDTLNGRVEGINQQGQLTFISLNDDFHRYSSHFVVEGIYGWSGEIGGEVVTGNYKGYEYPGHTSWQRYVSGIGLISKGYYDCGGYRRDLIYARIGGREIGSPPQPVATEEIHFEGPALDIFPNPFSDMTTIRLRLDHPRRVELAAYDIQGRQVAQIYEGQLNAGLHTFRFHAKELPAGLYLLRATGLQYVGSVLLLR